MLAYIIQLRSDYDSNWMDRISLFKRGEMRNRVLESYNVVKSSRRVWSIWIDFVHMLTLTRIIYSICRLLNFVPRISTEIYIFSILFGDVTLKPDLWGVVTTFADRSCLMWLNFFDGFYSLLGCSDHNIWELKWRLI